MQCAAVTIQLVFHLETGHDGFGLRRASGLRDDISTMV